MNSPPYHYFHHHQKQFPLPTEHSHPDLTHTHTLQQQNYVSASPFYHQQPTLHHSIHKPFTQPPPNYSSNIYQQPNTYQEPLNIITASSPPPICNPNFYQDPSFKYHQSVISSNPYTPYATVSHPYNYVYGYSTYHNNYPNQSHNPYSQSTGASQHTEVTQNSVNEFFQSSKDSVNEVRELNQASHQSLQNSVHEISELLNKLKELLIEESVEKNKQSSEKSTEVIETVVVQAPPDLTIASSPDLSSASSQPLPHWKPPVLKSHPYSIVPSSSTQPLLSTPSSIHSPLRPPTKPPDVQSQLSGFLFLREIFVNLFHDPIFWSKGIQINELIFA